MKQIYTLISFLCCINFISLAQTPGWTWAVASQGTFVDGLGLASDKDGNLYNVGCLSSTAIIGNDTINPVGLDCYISKTDSSGNFIWTITISGGQVETLYDISVDDNNNCFYVAGQTNSTMLTCNSVSASPYMLSSLSTGALAQPFIAKYDLNGNFIWIRTGKTPSNCANTATRVKIDNDGNAILAGTFDFYSAGANTIIFGTDTLVNNNMSTNDYEMFVVKYDPAGNVMWARQSTGGTKPASQGEFIDLAVDHSNNIYVTGLLNLATIVDFGNGVTVTHPYPAHSEPSYLVKYDQNGNAQWGKVYGNAGATGNLEIQSLYTSADDPADNIYIGGNVLNGNYLLGTTGLNGANTSLLFIAKLDSSANPVWVLPVSSPSAQFINIPDLFRITADACGAVYFSGHTPWADLHVNGVSNSLQGQLFVVKLDSSGATQWIQTATNGSSVTTKTNDIELSSDGTIILTGFLSGSSAITFNSSVLNVSAASTSTLFIARLESSNKECSVSTNVNEIDNDFSVFPNPTGKEIFINSNEKIKSVSIIDITGKETILSMSDNRISLDYISAGIYLLKITCEHLIRNTKIQVIK